MNQKSIDLKLSEITRWSATRVIATVVGVFFGLFSSINHGIFEILQGNNPASGIVIDAIGPLQRFWPEGTEPAFTLIPNYLYTGIAAVLVGIAIIIWSIWYLPTKHGRKVYLALFILSFLVGGGMGQAFFFIPAWAFATRMYRPLRGWKKILPRRAWPILARIWKITLPLAVILMLIGLEMAILGYFPVKMGTEEFMNTNMCFVFGSAFMFVVTFIAGFGQELLLREEGESSVIQSHQLEGEIA